MTDGLRIMLVEDDADAQAATLQTLQLAGFDVEVYSSAEACLRSLTPFFPGILLVDLRLPGMSGETFLERAKAIDETLPFIIVTAHGDVSTAVRTMRAGAYDFLEKPVANDLLIEVVKRAMEKRRLVFEVHGLRKKLELKRSIDGILLGGSAAMTALRNSIVGLSDVMPDVLIYGETGSGKELVSRALHACSPVRDGPFVAINCGAIPEAMVESELFGYERGAFTGAQSTRIGKIEHASGGTLFLDEVETMPPALQVKLLRVLQFRQLERLGSNKVIDVPVRVVAATKADLKQASDAGWFRRDLYFRFNVVTLTIPPLRDRREDIPELFRHHVTLAAARYKRNAPAITDQLLRDLAAHDWPGNVRELGNAADRFVLGLLGDRPEDAKGGHVPQQTLRDAVSAFERSLIVDALRRHRGDVGSASQSLEIPKKTLYDKIKRHAIVNHEVL